MGLASRSWPKSWMTSPLRLERNEAAPASEARIDRTRKSTAACLAKGTDLRAVPTERSARAQKSGEDSMSCDYPGDPSTRERSRGKWMTPKRLRPNSLTELSALESPKRHPRQRICSVGAKRASRTAPFPTIISRSRASDRLETCYSQSLPVRRSRCGCTNNRPFT